MPTLRPMSLGLGLLVFVCLELAAPAQAQKTRLEQWAADQKPCDNLAPVDRLKSISISQLSLVITGDDLELNLNGGIACRTSDQALIRGHASVDVRIAAKVSLTNCSPHDVSVNLSNFSGPFAPVLERFEKQIEQAFEKTGTTALRDRCIEFVG